MGPTSDLGPIDPQFPLADGSLAAGKAIIAAVEVAGIGNARACEQAGLGVSFRRGDA